MSYVRDDGNDVQEPEILEGLARDIVSHLAATLFAEDEVPYRDGRRAQAEPVAGEAPEVDPVTAGAPEPVAAPVLKFLPRVRLAGGDRAALLVRGTIRSGRQVRHNGDVVVFGDVNPGGQVVAAGDIVVMGTLRGMVHAGATGDHAAVVAAFRLSPTQLRIASYVSRPPEEPGGHPQYPELAMVREGAVVVRPLTKGMLSRPGSDETASDPEKRRAAPLIGKQ